MRHAHRVTTLALLLLSSSACKNESKAEIEAPPARSAGTGDALVELTAEQVTSASITTATVEARGASATLRLPGTLSVDAKRSWTVSPVVEGVVVEIGATTHDVVQKGQVLVRLRSVALGEAEVAWLEARAKLRIAEANRERNLGLRKEAVISEGRWLEVDAEFQRAQVALAQAENKLALLGLSPRQVEALDSKERRLSEMTLMSPGTGVVLASNVSRGQALGAGVEAFEVADLSSLWVTVHIPVASLTQVRVGAQATVSVPGGPRSSWNGKLDSLSGEVNADDQTIEGRVVVTNDTGFLRPGMHAIVEVVGAPVDSIMIPSGAPFSVGNQTYVFLKVGELSFHAVPVATEAPVGDWTPVSGVGLQPGAEVVIGGLAELKSHWLYAGGD